MILAAFYSLLIMVDFDPGRLYRVVLNARTPHRISLRQRKHIHTFGDYGVLSVIMSAGMD